MKRIATTIAAGGALVLCATALAGSPLSGTYNTTVGKKVLSGKVAGAWSINFSSPKYTITYKGASVAIGSFSVSGKKITFNDKSGPAACPGPGVYTFSLSGRTLKFKVVSDKNSRCAGRRAVLASTFTKKFSAPAGSGY